MMKTSLIDLHDFLFEQLERLGDYDLVGERLDDELLRAKAICDVSSQIISNANILLKAKIAADNFLNKDSNLPSIMND